MLPAITLRNLPPRVNLYLLQEILSANHVPWKQVALHAEPNDSESTLEAHVLLKGRDSLQSALRTMNGCEIADCIVEANEADETAITQFKEEAKKQLREKETWPDTSSDIKNSSRLPKDKTSSTLRMENQVEHCAPFDSLGLSPPVMENLKQMGFEITTPIQSLAIPPAMEGCDLIGRAQTGTGKTLAFSIPIVERLLPNPSRCVRALVLAPTRELAVQIKIVVEELILNTGLKTVVVYGGDSITDQMMELRGGVDILIATPGRLLDLRERGRLRFDAAEIIVLDEADRMMDMGFLPQIKAVFQCFHAHPQTMLFSATIPTELRSLTGVNLKNPVFVDVGDPDLSPLDAVTQKVYYVSPEEKEKRLLDLLDHEDGPILVFLKTKRDTEKLALRLKKLGYHATRIHGDIEQRDRMKAVEAFRTGRYDILVATDVASRGLHIEGIAHVVNYDLPMAPEDHLHRIGRTARAGAAGKATTFITHHERRSIKPFKTVLGLAP